jgi:hypothetical protein
MMLLKIVMIFVPKKYRAFIDAGVRVFGNLDTKAEIDAAMDYFITATQSDGYMSVGEGSRWLSMLGLIGKRKK